MADSKKQLLPVYLLVGDNELKKENAIARLKARLDEVGAADFNFDTFSGEAATGFDVVNACLTMPFASDFRIVVFNECDALKGDGLAALVEYVNAPVDTAVLVLTAEKLAKNTRLYKAVDALGREAIIECETAKGADLNKAVISLARKHGLTLSFDAAAALVSFVGSDMVSLDSEIERLSLAHAQGASLDSGDIMREVERTSDVKPWIFLDAFCKRDLRECLDCLSYLQDSSPYTIVSMLAVRIRELIAAKEYAERGGQKALAAALNVSDWKVKNHIRWGSSFREGELEQMLTDLACTEQAMKSGTDPDTALTEFLLQSIG